MNYTVKQIEQRLQTISDENDPFIKQCAQDERKGVQALLKKWNKKIQQEKKDRIRFENMSIYEKEARNQGFSFVVGIDEVGRGPLAGPIVASAVMLPEDIYLPGLDDSKKLTIKKREALYDQIQQSAISIGIGIVSPEEIDRYNIYEATKKAMLDALQQLKPFPDYLLIDAMELVTPIPQRSLVKGDAKSISIASASVIAKVYRDRIMLNYHKQYPQYHFDKNSGYGTKEHLKALHQFGPTPIHRKTFSPIKEMVEDSLFTYREDE
jgi:ribonuclease HII